MTTGAVIVDARGAARRLESLAMKCNSKEMPEVLDGSKPDSRWIAMTALFTGTAAKADSAAQQESAEIGGSAALAIADGRLIGIVSPGSDAEPALWFAWPIASLKIEGVGAQGMFKKRPKVLKITGPDGLIEMIRVLRLMPNSGAAQPGQEGALLTALAGQP